MKVVSDSTWDWRKFILRTMFIAFTQSKMDYVALAWQPWLSKTNMTRLDTLQNQALWIVTGQLMSTPLEALRLEANIPAILR